MEWNNALVVYYVIQGMHNKNLQRHMLTANTSTVESTALTIEEYVTVGVVDGPSCNATGE